MDFLSAAYALYNIYSGLRSSHNKPKTISYEDALSQAQAAINPSYATNLQRALSSLNSSAASRGVAGQDRTQNQMAAQVSANESQRSANVASAAQAIMNGQNAQNLAEYQAKNEYSQNTTKNVSDALKSLYGLYTNNGQQSWAKDKGGYQLVQGNPGSSGKYDLNNLDQYFQYQKVN